MVLKHRRLSVPRYPPSRTARTLVRFLPTPTPSVLVIGFLFWSGDGAGCVGGAADGVLRGSVRAEIKRTWKSCCCCNTAQKQPLSRYRLPQNYIQVRHGSPGLWARYKAWLEVKDRKARRKPTDHKLSVVCAIDSWTVVRAVSYWTVVKLNSIYKQKSLLLAVALRLGWSTHFQNSPKPEHILFNSAYSS